MRECFYIFGFILVLTNSLSAQPCLSDKSENFKKKLFENNLAYLPKETIALSDSLISILADQNYENCDLYWNTLFYKAEALIQLAEYPEALILLHKAIRVAERNKDHSIVARSYLFLALVHEIAGREIDCGHNLQKAIQNINEYSLYELYSWYCVRYSSFQRIFGDQDSAFKYAQFAVIVGDEVGDVRNQLDGHMLIAILSQDLETSILNFEKASDLYIEQKGYTGAAYQTFNIVGRLLKIKEYNRASIYLDKALSYLQKAPEKNMDFYQTMSRYYELKKDMFTSSGMLDSALLYSNKYIYNVENTQYFIDQGAINEAEIKFAVERERLRTSVLQQSSERLKIVLGFGAFFLLLLGGLLAKIYGSQKKIKRQNELISSRNAELKESNSRNEMLLSEVHHRVKNNLQNIISLIFLKEVNTEDDFAKEGLKDISSKIRSIALIHEQLYRNGEFEHIDIKEYFQELMTHFKEMSKGGALPLEFSIDAENISLNLETTIPLGIAFSELMTNSIKHAHPESSLLISISLVKDANDLFTFTFYDNGIGYQEEKMEKPGLGLKLVMNMARQLLGKLELSTDNGARASISFHEKVISKI